MGGIYALGDQIPEIDGTAWVHPDATVVGSVRIDAYASVWPAAVLRGDYGTVRIGARTSIQDGSVIHTTKEWPTAIGADCVVGHNVHVEGCTIRDRCLIGSGSVVLNRAVVEDDSAVGAAALVVENMVVPSGSIAVGVPARLRPAPPELGAWVQDAVEIYLRGSTRYRAELRRIG